MGVIPCSTQKKLARTSPQCEETTQFFTFFRVMCARAVNLEERWSFLDVIFCRRLQQPVATSLLLVVAFATSTLLLVYNSLIWNSIAVAAIAIWGEILGCVLLFRVRNGQANVDTIVFPQGVFVVAIPRADQQTAVCERQPPPYECPPDYEKCVVNPVT